MSSDPISVRVMSSSDDPADHAAAAVAALYQANALSMIRMAHVVLGDRGAAEDVVQDAFCGLYRRWGHLSDHDKALSYIRSSVLNGCRSALRKNRPELSPEPSSRAERSRQPPGEDAVIDEDERVTMMAALRKLPHRQREVLVLRFYLDLTDQEIAAEMGIGASTVRSAATRALGALGRMLGEPS
jgi:RNA polymerase sigma-70 factor (sigma-E family)